MIRDRPAPGSCRRCKHPCIVNACYPAACAICALTLDTHTRHGMSASPWASHASEASSHPSLPLAHHNTLPRTVNCRPTRRPSTRRNRHKCSKCQKPRSATSVLPHHSLAGHRCSSSTPRLHEPSSVYTTPSYTPLEGCHPGSWRMPSRVPPRLKLIIE